MLFPNGFRSFSADSTARISTNLAPGKIMKFVRSAVESKNTEALGGDVMRWAYVTVKQCAMSGFLETDTSYKSRKAELARSR